MKKKGLVLILVLLFCLFLGTINFKRANAETKTFAKVTSTSEITDGKYLIVSIDGKVCFNSASLADAANNGVSVTISDNTITIDEEKAFEITTKNSGYSIKSSSGKYIGNSSNANALKISASDDYTNAITIDNNGNANIVSEGSYLRYNSASDQLRFRYYKSSSYTGQKAVQLYKLQESGSGEGEGEDSGNTSANVASSELTSLISEYYGIGNYTKKTEIYIKPQVFDELEELKIDAFNGDNIDLERTTYYLKDKENNKDLLFMANLDGTFAELNDKKPVAGINSGYRTQTGKDGSTYVEHYVWNGTSAIKTYDTSYKSVEDWFVTLYDMTFEKYFDNWSKDGQKYIYDISETTITSDVQFKNFVAFTAPCLEEVFFGEKTKHYFSLSRLEISKENGNFGEYLSLRIYLSNAESGKFTGIDGLLSEARIYKNNVSFDEENVTVAAARTLPEGTFITMPVTLVKHVFDGKNYYYLQDKDGTEFTTTGTINAKLNDSFVVKTKINKITDSSIECNNSTIVGDVTPGTTPNEINSSIASILSHEVSIGQPVKFEGVVTRVDTNWNGSKMSVTVADKDGKTLKLYNTATEVAIGDVIDVSGKLEYSGGYRIAEGSSSSSADSVSDINRIAYAKQIVTLEETYYETFALPTSMCGTTIKWTSNNAAIVVDRAEAKVERTSKDEIVVLSATYEVGSCKETVEYKVTIPAAVEEGGIESIEKNYKFASATPTGLTISSTPTWYKDGGLKLDKKNISITTESFAVQNSINVTITLNALNAKSTANSIDSTVVFEVIGYDSTGKAVVTQNITSAMIKDKTETITLDGEGITYLKITFKNFPSNGSKDCNASLGNISIVTN